MKTSKSAESTTSNPLIASQPESLAKTGPLPVDEPDSQENALASFLSLRESCRSFDPVGLSSRMYPDFSVATEAETLQRSSGFSWSSAGMGYRGVSSTANFSESPNVAVVCTLSDILEPRAPRRFFLSARAAAGILRRAKKRGRILPEHLRRALESVATRLEGGKKTITTSPSTSGVEDSDGLRKQMGLYRRSKHPGEAIKEDPKSPPSSSPQASPQDLEGLEAEGLTMEQTSSMEPSKAIGQEDGRQSQGSTLSHPRLLPGVPRKDTEPRAQGLKISQISLFKMSEEEPEIRPTRGKESGSKRAAPATPSAKPSAMELCSPSPKTSEENSGQARSPLNSPQEEESPARGTHALPLAFHFKASSQQSMNPSEKCPSLKVSMEPAVIQPTPSEETQEESGKATIPTMSVRRLTPTECETLQGFPKGWTIPGNSHCSRKEWTRLVIRL